MVKTKQIRRKEKVLLQRSLKTRVFYNQPVTVGNLVDSWTFGGQEVNQGDDGLISAAQVILISPAAHREKGRSH